MSNNVTRWPKDDSPNVLLAIDPGASFPGRASKDQQPYGGCALFQWGELVWAALVKCPTVIENEPVPSFARSNMLVKKVCREAGIARFKGNPGETVNVLAVENPLIYVKGKARPNDIVALARIYGAFMGGIDADFYTGPSPQEWKGTLNGDILTERVARVLSKTEHTLLVKAQRAGQGGLTDHVLDGVGLGLFVLGRAGKAMVI